MTTEAIDIEYTIDRRHVREFYVEEDGTTEDEMSDRTDRVAEALQDDLLERLAKAFPDRRVVVKIENGDVKSYPRGLFSFEEQNKIDDVEREAYNAMIERCKDLRT